MAKPNRLKDQAKKAESAKKQALKVQLEIQKLSTESHVYNDEELLSISEDMERSCEEIIQACNKLI